MKIAIIRVGVDAGAGGGGIQGPLFKHRSFEYIPIPETLGIASKYTYGDIIGRHGRPLSDYFPSRRKAEMAKRFVHRDPEWDTFTYGTDTAGSQAGLRHLEKGDRLIFTCGLEGWGDCHSKPGIYLFGYFIVEVAGKRSDFSLSEERRLFRNNAHIQLHRERVIYYDDGSELILVKGSSKSRLLNKAVKISTKSYDILGRPIKVLSPKMIRIFGSFGGRTCIQRSQARWIVDPEHIKRTVDFLRRLV